MITLDRQSNVLHRLQEVHRSCAEMRLGQLLATIGMLGEDSTGRSLWDIDDDELLAAVETFASDLAQPCGCLIHPRTPAARTRPREAPCRATSLKTGD